MLIGGGTSPQRHLNQFGGVMPFWQRRIDMVAQAQTPLRFQVTIGISTIAGRANHDSDTWSKNTVANGGEIQLHHVGGWFDLGYGVALWGL